MTVATVTDLLKADDGDQPKAIKARLKAIYKRREGESNGRSYSFEDFELVDGDGKAIRCSLANHPIMDRKWIGRDIYLEAQKGNKGWSGLYIVDEKWTPKDSDEERTIRKLKVTGTCKLTLAGEESDNDGGNVEDDIPYGSDNEQTDEEKAIAKAEKMLADAKKKQEQKSSLAALHAKQAEEAKAKPDPRQSVSGDKVVDAKFFLSRAANAMLLCLRAAEYACKTHTDDKSSVMVIAPEQFQAITSTFFIAMDKRGLIDVMPVKPMEE